MLAPHPLSHHPTPFNYCGMLLKSMGGHWMCENTPHHYHLLPSKQERGLEKQVIPLFLAMGKDK